MHIHDWLRTLTFAEYIQEDVPLAAELIKALLARLQHLGHVVVKLPAPEVNAIFTTARFGEPVNWRNALMFTGRQKFKLKQTPTVFTFVQVAPAALETVLEKLRTGIEKDIPHPEDLRFPGMVETAYQTLFEQGKRGGEILALARLLQGQSKSIRVVLVVGDQEIEYLYVFDLVGAFPKLVPVNYDQFLTELAYRIVTVLSTYEITTHTVSGAELHLADWQRLNTPQSMVTAGQEFDRRKFFTDTVQIANLISVPALNNVIASQYSEGCFATWDPDLQALLTTVSGSQKPIYKGQISADDLAIIESVRPDGLGAVVRHVQNKVNFPPSSEAVELIKIDQHLPEIDIFLAGVRYSVPVARSKLHGHRSVAGFDSRKVEFVTLDPAYYEFPVSCATEAQAIAVSTAFSRSQALRNPNDPRQVVFTILPGHGVVMVEKWDVDKAPFQLLWEYMDAGWLQVANYIPQGRHHYSLMPDRWAFLSEA